MKKNLSWHDVIGLEKNKTYFKKIYNYISKKRKLGIKIYPKDKEVFNAFYFTKFHTIKIVILGQDPYCNPKQAHGLAFSVKKGSYIPPTLMNIFKELYKNFNNFYIPKHGCLQTWAEQGVLLLNTILTVEEGKRNSHKNIGWEIFTNKVIKVINKFCKGIIFLLWGNSAQKKIFLINQKIHYVLTASHPSPLSVNISFFGCKHFLKANNLLKLQQKKPINWFIN